LRECFDFTICNFRVLVRLVKVLKPNIKRALLKTGFGPENPERRRWKGVVLWHAATVARADFTKKSYGIDVIVASTPKELFGFRSVCSNGDMNHPPNKQVFGPVINRVSDVMAHTKDYAFKGVSRLARDARVSPASVSRLINQKLNPSFALVARLTTALEKQLGMKIDPRDLVAENGRFLTKFACDLVACPGCLPDRAMDEFGAIKSAYRGIGPGRWVTSRYPSGLTKGKLP